MNSTHHYEQLIEIFNSCFADDFNTRLIKGDDEPIYLPADAEVPYNRIVFAHGFYASAIHEISHWCIAGKARRELVDFGYWYCPDGRDAQTQSQFEDVEVKPQALDWLFCVAAGYPFNVSCDNLEGDFEPDRVVFQRRVHAQVMDYLTNGIPERPARFIKAPQNPANQHHCIGASYHRGSEDTAYSEDDQQQNRQRLIDCFPQAQWAKEVDVSDKEARCGVRCATRDHLPMVGNVPDYEATLVEYASLAEQKDEAVSAPVFDDLFMFAALGSRGLCSAPLCAEILAAQMSDEPIPMDASTLAALNPNRLWVRKLLKGKAVKAG